MHGIKIEYHRYRRWRKRIVSGDKGRLQQLSWKILQPTLPRRRNNLIQRHNTGNKTGQGAKHIGK